MISHKVVMQTKNVLLYYLIKLYNTSFQTQHDLLETLYT